LSGDPGTPSVRERCRRDDVETSDGRRQDDGGGGGGGTGSGVAATETVVDAAVMDRATAGACVAPTPGRA